MVFKHQHVLVAGLARIVHHVRPQGGMHWDTVEDLFNAELPQDMVTRSAESLKNAFKKMRLSKKPTGMCVCVCVCVCGMTDSACFFYLRWWHRGVLITSPSATVRSLVRLPSTVAHTMKATIMARAH